jgi:hypothetical protein
MKLSKDQVRNALLILALGVAFAFYGALRLSRLHDTAALYIGLPLVLAVVISLVVTEKITTTALKVLTIALLLSPIIIGEGFICVIMASPIMYAVTFFVALLIEQIMKSRGKGDKPVKSTAALSLLFLLSLEGTTPFTTIDRHNEITVERIVPLSVAEVRQALAATPRFDKRPATFYTKLFLPPDNVSGRNNLV